MAIVNGVSRVWRYYEEDFIVHWLYKVGHAWGLTNGIFAVADIVRRLAMALAERFPSRPMRSPEEIVDKVADLKARFLEYKDFCSFPGVRFSGRTPEIWSYHAYYSHVGQPEPNCYRRCRLYGVGNWRKQSFLFDGGYLGDVDLLLVRSAVQQ